MKIKTYRLHKASAIGFSNGFITYGHNPYKNKLFALEWKVDGGLFGYPAVLLYEKKTKPRFRNIYALSALFAIPSLILIAFTAIVLLPLYAYINGAYNWIRDRADETNVRYFNAINILLLLIFIVLFIWK